MSAKQEGQVENTALKETAPPLCNTQWLSQVRKKKKKKKMSTLSRKKKMNTVRTRDMYNKI